jgi:integrator complex subunit 1
VVLAVKDDDITMSDGACSEGTGDDSQFSWLVHQLPTIPHFEAVRPAVIAALRAAFLIETQPLAVAAYLRFLSTCALGEPIQEQADLSLVNNYIVTFFISEKICNYCGFVITGSCPGNCRA